MLRAVAAALAMFSAIPMPLQQWDKKHLQYVLAALPFVGFLIGLLQWTWLWAAAYYTLPPLLTGALAMLIPILLSGGIHLDGF